MTTIALLLSEHPAYATAVVNAYEKSLDKLAALEPVPFAVASAASTADAPPLRELVNFLAYLSGQAKAAVLRLDDRTKAYIEPGQVVSDVDPVLYLRPFRAPRAPPAASRLL